MGGAIDTTARCQACAGHGILAPLSAIHSIIILVFLFRVQDRVIMDLNDVGAQLDPENDEVFISGLPTDTTEQDIADYFGQIGIIKQVHGIRMSEG